MYKLDWREVDNGSDYSYNHFVNENREEFIAIINHFMPLPNWAEDWETKL